MKDVDPHTAIQDIQEAVGSLRGDDIKENESLRAAIAALNEQLNRAHKAIDIIVSAANELHEDYLGTRRRAGQYLRTIERHEETIKGLQDALISVGKQTAEESLASAIRPTNESPTPVEAAPPPVPAPVTRLEEEWFGGR